VVPGPELAEVTCTTENYCHVGRGAEKERECERFLTKGTKANRTTVFLDTSPFTPQLKGVEVGG